MGLLEILCAVGLLIPGFAVLSALAFVRVMLGAILTHLFVIGGSPIMPLVLLIFAAVVAWGRRKLTFRLLT